MLTGRVGCSHPHAIEQGRKDFKIYMDKLLERNSTLDSFRAGGQQQQHSCNTTADSPAWGTAVEPPDNASSANDEVKLASAVTADASLFENSRTPERSPSYSLKVHLWPRAGVATLPHHRIPPQFSWERQSPPPESVDHGGRSCDDDGVDVDRALFLPRGEAGISNLGAGAAVRTHQLGEDSDNRKGVADGNGDIGPGTGSGWKATWAKRFAHGPIHSEYQDKYLWPPESACVTSGRARGRSTQETYVGAKSRHLRSLSAHQTRREDKNNRNSNRQPTEQRQGMHVDGGEAPCAFETRDDRDAGRSTSEPRTPRSVNSVVYTPQPPRTESREDQDGELFESPQAEGALQNFEQKEEMALDERLDQSDHFEADEAEDRFKVARASRAAEAGSIRQIDAARRMWDDGRLETRPGNGYHGTGFQRYRAEAKKKREQGEVTIGGALQSGLTEYMDEYVWPSDLPKPGQRGKRTGMGVDHVARLLAGKTAEELHRVPDAGLVAKLGVASDRALKVGMLGNLMEMCRMRSPPPAARRLALALVVALGLRWRQWSDIRAHLLGNISELRDVLARFNKDRPGLTSTTIQPFAEDPNLSPIQIKQVAVSMVWVSRWLLALYDYLMVKEGRFHTPPARLIDLTGPSCFKDRRRDKRQGDRDTHKLHSRSRPSSSRSIMRPSPPMALCSQPQPEGRKSARMSRERKKHAVEGSKSFRRSHGSPIEDRTGQATEGARANMHPRHGAVAAGVESTVSGQQVKKIGDRSCPEPERTSRDHAEDERRQHEACIGSIASSVPGSPLGTERRSKNRRSREDGPGVRSKDTNSELDSESIWTIGTITSRGDILEAPTEDNIDIGSISKEGGDINSGDEQIDLESSERSRRRSTKGSKGSRRAAAVRTKPPKDTNTGVARDIADEASVGCTYAHVHKGLTPSRFANPMARPLVQGIQDPILANRRWPPQADIRQHERTEQRSAFSLEHSFLAAGLGRE